MYMLISINTHMSISKQYFDNNKKYEKEYGYKSIVIYLRNSKWFGKNIIFV